MKKSNLPVFFLKAVFACIVPMFTAGTALAQITLDFGVLADDYPAEDTASSKQQQNKITLENPEKEVKKPASPQKPKKAVSAKKETVKSNPPKPKTTAKPKGKYQVKESAIKDEHDRLKPEAAPAPKVKIISSVNFSSDKPQTDETKQANEAKTNAPKISKHFLEQTKNETQNGVETKPADEMKSKPETKQNNVITEKNRPSVFETSQKETAKKSLNEQPQAVPQKKETLSLLYFSVYPVSEKLGAEERSALLSNELPEDSATAKAIDDGKLLTQILIFEKASSDLTEEMQNVLNETALLMKKYKSKRLILYSYSSENPADPGKERQYALRRALAVRSYLTLQGVLSLRVELRAQGTKGAGDKIPDRTDMVLSDR